MHYAYPQLLPIGATVFGAVVGLTALTWLRRRRALRLLAAASAAPTYLVSRPRRLVKALLLVAAACLIGVCLLGPQWGEITDAAPEPSASGRDVLIVLDVSRSMLAEDVAPNRLARAKADIRDLVLSLERRGGHRVGLIGFADSASVVCPLTSDYRCFEEERNRLSLETLRARGGGGDDGTQIGNALAKAADAVDPEFAAFTDVLLLSDGGDMEATTLAAADALAQRGVPVHTFGLGDAVKEAFIPVTRSDGSRGFLKHKNDLVRTKLEEGVLKQIAARTGGQYVAVGTGFVELDRWYERLAASGTERQMPGGGPAKLFVHRYQGFLLAAIVLLLLNAGLDETARPPEMVPTRARYFVWSRKRRRAAEAGGGS